MRIKVILRTILLYFFNFDVLKVKNTFHSMFDKQHLKLKNIKNMLNNTFILKGSQSKSNIFYMFLFPKKCKTFSKNG